MFNIIAPEFIVLVAIDEYISAKNGEKEIEDEKWTRAHAFFADMGGFKIKVQPSSSLISTQDNEENKGLDQQMSLVPMDESTEDSSHPG